MEPSLIDQIGQIISSYGFPIVACGALFWYIVKEQRETRDVLDQLKSIIQSNTETQKLILEFIKGVARHE